MQRRILMEQNAGPTVPHRSLIDERVPPLGIERNRMLVRKLMLVSFAALLVRITFLVRT